MASFADLIYGTAQNAAQDVGQGVSQGIAKGAELALRQEQLQQSRQDLQMKQAQLKSQQLEKLYGFVADAKNYQNAADRNNYLKNAIGFRNALGLDQTILPDDRIKALGSDESMGRIAALQGRIERGDLTIDQASQIVQDPQAFAKIMPVPPEALNIGKADWQAAQKDVLDRQSREKTATERGSPFQERNALTQHSKALSEIGPSSPIQKQIGASQAISNAYAAFKASGGMGQEFNQYQTALRLNQGSAGGRTGVNERAAAHASDLGITVQQYIQLATGEVQDVNLTGPKLVKAMKDVGEIETKQLQKQALEKVDLATSGYKTFYSKHPEQAADYYDRVSSLKKQINNSGMGTEQFNLGGRQFTRGFLEQFLKDHPNDSAAPQIKQLLGGQ